MDFTLLPDLTPFMIGFVIVAALGVIAAVASVTMFLVGEPLRARTPPRGHLQLLRSPRPRTLIPG